ncbi:hypothetical protein [Corynebacterium tapiri]|uniref:Uncharacterized protein n=1 Tax=Corynebacterium tapiri TaxID=1448266 RepID=A0A5C4U5V3_9CORY|nr:hypothetical protein [Corynebacterium tapiri]TNL97753.1 hypothetical protein FHE74_05300 [Corynebacterium tapiri]
MISVRTRLVAATAALTLAAGAGVSSAATAAPTTPLGGNTTTTQTTGVSQSETSSFTDLSSTETERNVKSFASIVNEILKTLTSLNNFVEKVSK